MKLWESLGSRPLFSSLRSLFESDRLASLRKTSMTIILWKSTSIDVFLYCFTAMSAHFLMSLGQTLFHRYLGHSRLGGRFFKNHLQFHHGHYSGDHVVSDHYLNKDGNNTPYFFDSDRLGCRVELFIPEIGLVHGSASGDVAVILRACLS